MNDEEQQLQKNIIELIDPDWQINTSFQLFREKLAAYINDLISHDFNKLVNLLYRLDVSEKKLNSSLASCTNTDAGIIIADLIIEREIQKIQLRQFKQQDKDIPEEDKW